MRGTPAIDIIMIYAGCAGTGMILYIITNIAANRMPGIKSVIRRQRAITEPIIEVTILNPSFTKIYFTKEAISEVTSPRDTGRAFSIESLSLYMTIKT